jgi:hypothetical protein
MNNFGAWLGAVYYTIIYHLYPCYPLFMWDRDKWPPNGCSPEWINCYWVHLIQVFYPRVSESECFHRRFLTINHTAAGHSLFQAVWMSFSTPEAASPNNFHPKGPRRIAWKQVLSPIHSMVRPLKTWLKMMEKVLGRADRMSDFRILTSWYFAI